MNYWIVRTANGYKILKFNGEYVIFFTHASHVKSYVYSHQIDYKMINLKTDPNTVKDYEFATNERWYDYTSSRCF